MLLTLRGTDPCGEWLAFATATPPSAGTLGGFTRVDPSTVTVLYTPNTGGTGWDWFSFTVSDGVNAPAEGFFTVTSVSPTPQSQTLVVNQNTPEQPTAVDILLRTELACTGPLDYVIVPGQGPTHGALSVVTPEDGSSARVTYTPQQHYVGPDSFYFYVTKGAWESGWALVTIYVVPSPVLNAACGPGEVLLYWAVVEPPAAAGLVAEFVINRRPAQGGPYTTIATVAATARDYRDPTAQPGQTYCQVVTLRYRDPTTEAVYESAPSNEKCLGPCDLPPGEQPVVAGWIFTDLGFVVGGQNGAFRAYNDPAQVSASPWSFPSTPACITPPPTGLLLRMNFEDDANCTGEHGAPYNDNVQIATAVAVASVGCPTWLTLKWCAMVEQQNTGYDRMWSYVDGTQVGYAQSTEALQNCAPMAPLGGTADALLQPGVHLLDSSDFLMGEVA